MKKEPAVAAAAGLLFLLCGFTFFGITFGRKEVPGETPEHLFNTANEYMIKGDNTAAIELYYRIVEEYPDFKEYRADVLYRLGTLLFRLERYEEAEKVFRMLADKYRDYGEIQKTYERLLYIYVQEFHDSNKAGKIREIYEKRFGNSEVLQDIDKTVTILNNQGAGASGMLKLNPANLEVTKADESTRFDGEFFPVRNYMDRAAESPDRKFTVERKKENNKYVLYMADLNGGKPIRIEGGKNGFAPQWLWDGSGIIFTAMDWGAGVRYIKRYDTVKRSVKTLFGAKDIGPLTCISPDASKIAFWYGESLWLMTGTGSSLSLIGKGLPGKNAFMMAWSREGDKILIGHKTAGGQEMYTVCSLGRKDFVIVK
jgi:hypothetical protein